MFWGCFEKSEGVLGISREVRGVSGIWRGSGRGRRGVLRMGEYKGERSERWKGVRGVGGVFDDDNGLAEGLYL